MRGQTIKLQVNGKEFRRSTKHVKYNGKAYNGDKKWALLFGLHGVDFKK